MIKQSNSLVKNFLGILFIFTIASSCSRQHIQHQPTDLISSGQTVITTSERTTNPILPIKNTPNRTSTNQVGTRTVAPMITTSLVPTIPGTETSPMMDNRYLVLNNYNEDLYLVDSVNGKFRKLESEVSHPLRLISFTKDGCGLIVQLDNKSIVQIDLKAKVTKMILQSGWYEGRGWIFGETIPNSEEWIAYTIGQGMQGYDSWEFEDVETMRLSDRTVFRITEHSGARVAEWSPDSSRIAFTDFDETNNSQIFIANADGTEKTQLTYFKKERSEVIAIRWSPDGKKLAFKQYEDSNGSSSLGMVLLGDGNSSASNYYTMPLYVRNLWWNDEDILVIHSSYENQSQSSDYGSLVWLNTQTGNIIARLNGSETPDNYIVSADYFDQSKVAFFSDSGFFTYDYRVGMVYKHFDSRFNYSDWSIAPLNFPGERNCTPP